MAARLPPNIWRNDIGSDPWNEKSKKSETDLAGVVVDDEALVPAVEVFVRVDLDAELLQHRLVGPLAHRVHGGAHVIQDAHDARRILSSQAGYFTFAQISSLLFDWILLPNRRCRLGKFVSWFLKKVQAPTAEVSGHTSSAAAPEGRLVLNPCGRFNGLHLSVGQIKLN